MSLQPAILAQMSEQDEAGKVVRTYVLSSSSSAVGEHGKHGEGKRVDVIVRVFLSFFISFWLMRGKGGGCAKVLFIWMLLLWW